MLRPMRKEFVYAQSNQRGVCFCSGQSERSLHNVLTNQKGVCICSGQSEKILIIRLPIREEYSISKENQRETEVHQRIKINLTVVNICLIIFSRSN